ncbi:MAG: right-handed parallel beta-helix repeat-containing protein [Candidatus Korobacteraceae bacterium]|jgi:hypothetical protein
MPTISRLAGRFFSVLLPIILATLLAPAVAIGQSPTLCHITDTVYRADGTPAQGTALISWPAFTTAAGQAVTPGSLTVTLDPSGGFNASLAPNTGASPAGTYYRAIFKLDDGTTDSEFWVVPNAPTTTIGAIRSKLVPSSQAAQLLTRDYADSTYVSLASTQTITGVKTFSNSPAVPTPQNPTDAANKAYVDSTGGGGGNLASPPPIGNVTPNTGNFTTLTAQNINGVANPGNYPQPDPCAQINAALAALPSSGGTIDARGFAPGQVCAATLTVNKPAAIWFGAGRWLLGGCPGIEVSSPGVSLAGLGQTTSGVDGGASATVFSSDPPAPCPLIQSVAASADSATIRDLELDGNGRQGLMGMFWPWSGNLHLINVRAHDFLQQGIYALGGMNAGHDLFLSSNGGDGVEWGPNGMIDGRTELYGNGKAGLHIVGGGNRIGNVKADFNATQGIYLDGRLFPDWSASTAQVVGNIIRPSAGNGNSYAFVAISCTADCKTGTSAPTWNQTPGAQIVDNHVTWLDAAGLAAGGSNGYGNQVTAPNLAYNLSEQLRLEGDPAHAAAQNVITGFYGSTAGSNSTASSMGLHLLQATQTVINGATYYGSALNQQNDVGAIVIDAGSSLTALSNCLSYLSHNSAVQVLNGASYTTISNCQVYDNADSTTTGNNLYGIYVAPGTTYTTFSNVSVVDARSTAYSLGLYDNGTSDDQSGGYRSNITGNATPDRFASTAGIIVDQDSGLGHNLRLSSPDHITFGSWPNPSSVNSNGFNAPSFAAANFPVMDLRAYGLKGDGILQTGCNITSGQKVVTCSGSSFSAADVGKAAFFQGAGAAGAFLNTSIASYQSATQVTLQDAASTTVANGSLWYGTDNTAAWCAAMNCTSATPPNRLFSVQPGRTVLLPRGTYFISGTAYTRNNDNLIGAGQAATQVLLFNPANSLNALCMGSNASAGSNTCTQDSGTQNIDVEGILWGTPENGSQVCINPLTYSGFEIKNNWFECGIGVFIQGNIGSVIGNTFDSSTFNGVVVKGDGEDYGNNPSHSILISDNHFFANKWSAIQVDGASGVQIHHNNILYAKQFSIYVASPESYSTYRLNISNNNFATSTGFWNPTENHIYVTTPLVRSVISGNTFGIARDSDILLNSSGIVGLNISNNKFSGGQLTCGGSCTASLQVSNAGAGLTISGNQWDSPGSYAADFQTPAYLSNNYCTHPFAVIGLPANDYDKACFRFAAPGAANFTAKDNVTDSSSVAAVVIRGGAVPAYSGGNRSAWPTADVYVFSAAGPIASANERVYNGTGNYTVFTTMSDPATGNASFAGDLTARDIPGHEYFVSHYASLQAAINAAYNNGAVLGAVIDDRTSPYTGPGFILYDSVTLKLAATTYTINSTVTYNNGNNVVTAGIIALPGARLIGASTSSNHGTIITAANALNADLIATSTVGTGIGSAAQWWHWGGFQDLRVTGNGANQTAGNCFNIENMGETAFLRTIEVSGCYLDNILFTGASATASDIANITTNSAGRYGFNFNNLSGVAVVHGLSGDSNTTSIVRLNGGQSGTLTILGFKTEEEISGQDPLITIDQTGQNGAQPSLYIVGGYTFGRSGVNDVIKYVNGTVGTTPYISVNNFYVQNYVNAVNDVVNSRTTAAANMNKVPFYYGPTGGFLSGQAFTLDLNTFVQSPHSGNGILTEILGTTSSNETVVAASGTSTDLSVGGIGFRMPNRTIYGQSPELFAKMTYAFPGGVPNTQQWEFIPAKVGGDNSTRWLGDPSYRWDEIYSADVNATTATVGTLNVTTCNGCGTGTRLVSGTMQGATATLTGNSADQTLYTATLPAGTFAVGAGIHCFAKWTHPTASGAITYKWTLGTTTWAYGAYTSSSVNLASDIEVLTISSLASQSANLSPVIAGTAIGIGGSYGNAGSENLANADTIKLTFNGGSSDQVKGATFYCQTVQ